MTLQEENEMLRGLLREIRPTMPREVLELWCKDRDAALSQQAVPACSDEQPAVFWVLFDATGPERFIKKDVSDGTLAFFDSEDEAQRAKRRHTGTDYKRVEYYRAPLRRSTPSQQKA